MAKGNTSQMRRRARRQQRARKNLTAATPIVEALNDDHRETLAALAADLERHPATIDDLRDALIASGDAAPALLPTYEMTEGTLAHRFFVKAALDAGFTDTRGAWWPCEMTRLEPSDDAVFRVDDDEQVVRLADGTLAHLSVRYGAFRALIAGPGRDDAFAQFSEAYPASYITHADDGRVPITFWMQGQFGAQQRLRRIDAQPWADVERNYGAEVRGELARVMEWSGGDDANGQLLLWQGTPGTGKTWALRALASEWAPWAEFHYITDPDQFFGKSSSYMIDVLLSDSYMALEAETGDVYDEQGDGGKWKVLILEDTGDLLAANARESYSAGLSRLLNVVDGMIGQGLRVLALVTTNDQLDDFHPAVTRPGRCASQVTFGPLSAEEASEWLGETVDEGGTIAELYARAHAGVEPFASMGACDGCDHAFSEHLGSEGPCTSGDCSCSGYVEPDAGEAAADDPLEASAEPVATAFVRIRPDMGTFYRELSEGLEGLVDGIPVEHADTIRYRLRDFVVVNDGTGTGTNASTTIALEADAAVAISPPSARPGVRWQAVLCPESEATDDGRIFAPGSVSWRDLPLTLMAMIETSEGGHVGAQVAGRIDRIWKEGDLVMGEGVFDGGEYGSEIARMVGDGTLRGVSVDLAISEMELAYRSQILDEAGNWIGPDVPPSQRPDEESAGPDIMDLFDGGGEPLMFVVWDGIIGMATVCPFPAFARATIETDAVTASGTRAPMVWRLTHQGRFSVVSDDATFDLVAAGALKEHPGYPDVGEPIEAPADGTETLLASAAPVTPPASRFRDPELPELTPLTVEADDAGDGWIYGHAAGWGSCHTGFPDSCTTAPTSRSDYAYFHLKEVECEDGELVSVGTITLDTGHAGARASREQAARHYDHTGTAVADIVCGEDEHGIWFSGSLRSDLTDAQVRKLRGAVLSGDWRNVNGTLEMIALLAVNVPGFPVPRHPRPLVAGGQVVSLVAAGIPGSGPHVSARQANVLGALALEAGGELEEIAGEAA